MRTTDQIVKISDAQLEHYADEYIIKRLHLTSAMTFEQYLTGRLGGWNYEEKPVKELNIS